MGQRKKKRIPRQVCSQEPTRRRPRLAPAQLSPAAQPQPASVLCSCVFVSAGRTTSSRTSRSWPTASWSSRCPWRSSAAASCPSPCPTSSSSPVRAPPGASRGTSRHQSCLQKLHVGCASLPRAGKIAKNRESERRLFLCRRHQVRRGHGLPHGAALARPEQPVPGEAQLHHPLCR